MEYPVRQSGIPRPPENGEKLGIPKCKQMLRRFPPKTPYGSLWILYGGPSGGTAWMGGTVATAMTPNPQTGGVVPVIMGAARFWEARTPRRKTPNSVGATP